MIKVGKYLDEAIDRRIARNDSDIAKQLGVSRSAISLWRLGRSAPNEDQAAKLAELLGKPEIMAECMAHRAKEPQARAAWERLARMAMQSTLGVIMGVTFVMSPTPANASTSNKTLNDCLYYVKLQA